MIFLEKSIFTLTSPNRRHNFKDVANLGLLSCFEGNDLRKRTGDDWVEAMSQQDMQKVMEGLRVMVEWLQRGKETKSTHETDSNWNRLPEVLEIKELAEVLNVSRWTAYELCRRPDFPAVRIGRRILVRKDQLNIWLDKQIS